MKKFKEVCVIDDDKVFHFIIKKLFVKSNLEINPTFYFNGQEAIENIKNNLSLGISLPDLILLDINMPIMDGWQFLDEFREINIESEKTTIYLISSSDSLSDITKSREYQDQIKEYILKPMTVMDLSKIF